MDVARLNSQLGLDFDDSLQYYIAQKKRLSLVTLDRDFSKIKDVRVISPEKI